MHRIDECRGRIVIRVMLHGLAMFAVAGCVAHSIPGGFNPRLAQEEINTTLWRPFRAAFEQLDGAALNALYAKQVLRVTAAGVDTEEQFKVFNQSRFAENLANGDRVGLQFWFDSRHTNPLVSYEVGFYRLSVETPAGAVSHFYGQFHVVLRRIAGTWKIVQDWDTDRIGGRVLGAADFDRQPPAVL